MPLTNPTRRLQDTDDPRGAEGNFFSDGRIGDFVIGLLAFLGFVVCICWLSLLAVRIKNLLLLKKLKQMPTKVEKKAKVLVVMKPPKRKRGAFRSHPALVRVAPGDPDARCGARRASWMQQFEKTKHDLAMRHVKEDGGGPAPEALGRRKKRRRQGGGAGAGARAQQQWEEQRRSRQQHSSRLAIRDQYRHTEAARDGGLVKGLLQFDAVQAERDKSANSSCAESLAIGSPTQRRDGAWVVSEGEPGAGGHKWLSIPPVSVLGVPPRGGWDLDRLKATHANKMAVHEVYCGSGHAAAAENETPNS